MAARSKAWFCGRTPAGNAGSNPAGAWMFLIIFVCVQRSISRTYDISNQYPVYLVTNIAFPGSKAAGSWCWPSSAEVANRLEISHSPLCLGWPLHLSSIYHVHLLPRWRLIGAVPPLHPYIFMACVCISLISLGARPRFYETLIQRWARVAKGLFADALCYLSKFICCLRVLSITRCLTNFFLYRSTSAKKHSPAWRYVVGSKSFRPDTQKSRQTENAVRDI